MKPEEMSDLLIKFVTWSLNSYGFVIPINLVLLFIASQQENTNDTAST